MARVEIPTRYQGGRSKNYTEFGPPGFGPRPAGYMILKSMIAKLSVVLSVLNQSIEEHSH